MANYVFKSFCVELDGETLAQMLKIVSTPNEKAAEIMEDQGEDEDSDGDESYDEEEASDSDDSIDK